MIYTILFILAALLCGTAIIIYKATDDDIWQ